MTLSKIQRTVEARAPHLLPFLSSLIDGLHHARLRKLEELWEVIYKEDWKRVREAYNKER